MLTLAQMLFLASLAGAVLWLAYLARHQDAAGAAAQSARGTRASRGRQALRSGRP